MVFSRWQLVSLSPHCEYINHQISFRGSSIFSLFFALLIVILDLFLGIETNEIGGDYVDFCLVNRKRLSKHGRGSIPRRNESMNPIPVISYCWNTLQKKYLLVTFCWRILFRYRHGDGDSRNLSECSSGVQTGRCVSTNPILVMSYYWNTSYNNYLPISFHWRIIFGSPNMEMVVVNEGEGAANEPWIESRVFVLFKL